MDFINSDANYERSFYKVYPSPEVPEEVKKENKRLCDTYPFLIPSNRFSGKRINSGEKGYWPGTPEVIPQWDYEYTELDAMPDGWRKAFGEQMCAEIKQALLEDGGEELLDKYRIDQIKEKYGYLRWYDSFSTVKIQGIIHKYETISQYTCINCGAPATKITRGWISPFCDNCVPNVETIPVKKHWENW